MPTPSEQFTEREEAQHEAEQLRDKYATYATNLNCSQGIADADEQARQRYAKYGEAFPYLPRAMAEADEHARQRARAKIKELEAQIEELRKESGE